jgi:hypothetical protein
MPGWIASCLLAAAVAAGVAGCGSGGYVVVPPSASGEGVIGPVIVEPDQTEATLDVGRILYFSVEQPIGTTLASSDPQVLDVTQAAVEGDMVTAPTAKALRPGSATIEVIAPDGSIRMVAVTVTGG